MKEKKSFGKNLENFFEGKGFYIVLFLCAGVISVSSWVLMTGTNVDEPVGNVGYIGATVTPEIVKITPPPAETDTIVIEPVETEVPTPEVADTQTATVWTEADELFVRPVNGEIITPYSVDALVYNETMEDWRAHDGIDISAELGEHVLAVSAGQVTEIENDTMYGTTVTILHAEGIESVYANLATQPTVSVGDKVVAGEIIGAIGDTALCESALEAHLHFAMKEAGGTANPEFFLP